MKQQHLKILRYNTGTDKKAFVQFKDFFDAAIFNATIVAYSGASVADLISMHSRRYIIDPQTHIFQQELSAYTTENKKTHIPAIKKSVTKYLEKMPAALADKILKLHQKPEPELIAQNLDALVECVYAKPIAKSYSFNLVCIPNQKQCCSFCAIYDFKDILVLYCAAFVNHY